MSRPRLQRSTVAAAAVFVVTGILYVVVRPDDQPAPGDSPIPVYVVTTTTTTVPDTIVSTSVPIETTVPTETSVPTETTVPPASAPPISLEPTGNTDGSS